LNAGVDVMRESASCAVTARDEFQQQLIKVTEALEQAIARNNLASFYRVLRATDVPFLPASYEGNAEGLFRHCFECVHRLGSISPALALAVENHLYVVACIATLPAGEDPEWDERRRALLSTITKRRLLVANTNSHVQGKKIGQTGARAAREGAGFRVTGRSSYASLSTQADVLLLVSSVENEGPAMFIVDPLQDNPGIEIGPYVFPSAMLDSDTRQITFRDLFLPAGSMIIGPSNAAMEAVSRFAVAWHQSLLAGLYLGAAARAIEEVRKFLRSTRNEEGRPLADLDGSVVDVGRLGLDYWSAHSLVVQAGQSLGNVKALLADDGGVGNAFHQAMLAKYAGTRSAEAIVTAARRISGARAFAGGHPLERISQEVIFGSLGPEVSAVIERLNGQQVLQDYSFLDVIW
jgi:alkylation response protein AidB-like acyl-CoA dehydrogenase